MSKDIKNARWQEGCQIWTIDIGFDSKLIEWALKERNDKVLEVPYDLSVILEEDSEPDIIILPVYSGAVDGTEMYQELRKIERFRNTPVLLWRVARAEVLEVYERLSALGFAGCMRLVCTPEHMLEARDTILQGGTYYPWHTR